MAKSVAWRAHPITKVTQNKKTMTSLENYVPVLDYSPLCALSKFWKRK